MSRFRLCLAAAAVAVAAACGSSGGSGSSVATLSKNDVAVVGSRHITRNQLDHQIALKLRALKISKQPLPKQGTSSYQSTVVQPVVQSLVFAAQVQNIAQELGVSVSTSEVTKTLDQDVKQYYGGDQQKFQAQLKKYGVSMADVQQQVSISLLQQKLQKKIVGEVKITDADVKKYYDQNKSNYGTQDSRPVRFVLVDGKGLATRLRAQLSHGGSWTKIAKKYSKDPGSAAQGGKFTAQKGAVVPQFEMAAFGLDQGQLSQPIQAPKSYVGQACKVTCYFLIEPIGPVKKGTTQPLSAVKDQIKQTLLQQKQQTHLQDRVKALLAEQKKVTKYASAYRPPSTAPGTSPSSGGGST